MSNQPFFFLKLHFFILLDHLLRCFNARAKFHNLHNVYKRSSVYVGKVDLKKLPKKVDSSLDEA